MRVAFYVYPTAFQAPGGGEILLLKLQQYLKQEGLHAKLFDPWHDRLTDFDILHTFGSVKDCLEMMRLARTRGVRNVLSTVCWYSWQAAWGTSGGARERLLHGMRYLAKAWLPWLPSQRKSMMRLAEVLIPNSVSEADQLCRFFRMPREKIKVIPNGVDPRFHEAAADEFVRTYGIKDFILCVGRIEPRKNQLSMIRALKGTGIPLVLIGRYVPRYKAYYDQCVKEAGGNVRFLDNLPHDSSLLASAYAACNTFLLASWLETPGLAALEAGAAGAKVVVTDQGAAREYFGGFAAYVSPKSLNEIRKTTLRVFREPKDPGLSAHIRERYSWRGIAKRYLEIYRELILTPKGGQDVHETPIPGGTCL